jgi:hypothetical protein
MKPTTVGSLPRAKRLIPKCDSMRTASNADIGLVYNQDTQNIHIAWSRIL